MKQGLILEHVSVNVGDTVVVSDVSLSVHPGKIHVLMGPNGSGKSSLASLLVGHPAYTLPAKNSTHITLNGSDLLTLTPDERARAGLFVAFQYPVAIPGLLVWRLLLHSHRVLTPEKQQLKALAFKQHLTALATEFGIEPSLLERSVNDDMSGGEKKRIELLSLAVLRPKYAVIDEIDSGLDVDGVKLIARGLEKLRKEHGIGMLLITHYDRVLKYLTVSQVSVMRSGKLTLTGGSEVVAQIEQKGYKSV